MTDFTLPLAIWLARTLIVGGIVLTVGWLIARRLNPTAVRDVAGWGVRGALLAAVLCAIPAWIALPMPNWVTMTEAKVTVEPKLPPRPYSPSDALRSSLVADVRKDEGEWQFYSVPFDAMDENEDGLSPQTVVQGMPLDDEAESFSLTAEVSQPSPIEATAVVSNVGVDVLRIVLIAYGIGVGIALIQLALSQWAVWRIVLASSPAPGLVRERFAAACDRAGVAARLLLSSRVSSPVCFGLIRPTVVLPKTFAQTAYDAELNWVFAHELAHLARGDHRLVWWVGIARALFFPVPAFWAIRRQLGLAQEYLADAAAATVSGAAAYAEFLVTLSTGPGATRTVNHPLTATGVKAGRSDLFRRVTMLVANEPATARKPSRTWKILAAGGTLGAVILLSGFGIASEPPKPVDFVVAAAPTAAPDDQDDKKAAEAKAKADELRAKADALKARAEAAQKEAVALMKLADMARAETDMARAEARKLTVQTIRVDVDAKEIEKIKQEIVEAAKKGDADGAKKAADKLARIAGNNGRTFNLTTGEPVKDDEKGLYRRVLTVPRMAEVPVPPAAPRVVEGKPIPPVAPKMVEGVPVPPAAPPRVGRALFAPSSDATKQAMERGLKQFKDSLERVKDNPEAKAEIEKAMKAFEKAMKETMEKMPKMMEEFRAMPGAEWKFEQAMPDAEFKLMPQEFRTIVGPDGLIRAIEGKAGGGEGRLGISIQPVPPEAVEKHGLTKGVGVMIVEVRDGSPAAKAGLKKEDILLQFAGKPVPGEPGDAVKLVGQVKADEKVKILVLRNGEKKELKDIVLPEVKATKVRVLEALPENMGQLQGHLLGQMKELHGEHAEKLHQELARVQEEIKRLHEEGAKSGGKVEGVKNRSLGVSVNGDDVTIHADENGVKFEIKATKGSGVSSIKVKDGDKTIEATSVKELPEKYRKSVESFMKSVKIDRE